jgi:DNA-binding SARP family transcriptional activator
MVGVALRARRLRIYLAGPLCVEWGGRVLTERDLPSRQARVLLAFLVCERARPASRDALAELLWPGGAPPSWETSLKALVSKLRPFTSGLAPRGSPVPTIHGQYGCYQLELPGDAWVDVEAARASLDEAEGALRRACPQAAWGPFNVAVTVARRGFLPGEDGAWVEEQRRSLERLLVRALDGYAGVALDIDQPALAVEAAHEAIRLDRLREPSWRALMRGHEALGHRPEAIATFHRLKAELREELGVSPAAETEALFIRILQGRAPAPPHPVGVRRMPRRKG